MEHLKERSEDVCCNKARRLPDELFYPIGRLIRPSIKSDGKSVWSCREFKFDPPFDGIGDPSNQEQLRHNS